MLEGERRIIDYYWADFKRIVSESPSPLHEARLIEDISGLMAIYNMRFNSELYSMINEMIQTGKKRGFNMLSAEVELNNIRERHKSQGSVVDSATNLRGE